LLLFLNVVLQIFPLLELQRSLLVTRRCYARRYAKITSYAAFELSLR
jgi:hypothetical protein